MHKKIFVSIAAYRGDVFTVEETINNLISKAKHPERLRFGVCMQNDSYVNLKSKFKDNVVDVVFISLDQFFGVTRARAILKNMCTEEDYFLQVDSHADAIQDWDYYVIQDYENVVKKTNNNKIVLSSKHMMKYTTDNEEILYQYDDNKDVPVWFHNFNWLNGIPAIDISPFYNSMKDIFDKTKVDHLLLTNFLSAHFVFSGKHFIDNFNMSTYITFFGEEPEFSLRLFCDGYDIYNYYDRAIIIHDSNRSFHHVEYNEIINVKKEEYIKEPRGYNSLKEVENLFRYGKNNFINLENKQRSVKDFFDFHLISEKRRIYNLPEGYSDPSDYNKYTDKPGHDVYSVEYLEKQLKERQ
jgi:hypothetical protein